MDALRELKDIVSDKDISDFDRKQAIVEILRLKPDANYVLDTLLPIINKMRDGSMRIKIWAIATENKLTKQYQKDWRKEAEKIVE